MTTIPETVARVLDLDAQGTPNPELTAYYRTAAPALAREVERLEKMLDVCGDVHAHNVKLVADRNTARRGAQVKARKPGPFKIDCVDVAWCDVIDDDGCGRFVATQRVYMSASDAKRFAAWLTKAAAWCREGGR